MYVPIQQPAVIATPRSRGGAVAEAEAIAAEAVARTSRYARRAAVKCACLHCRQRADAVAAWVIAIGIAGLAQAPALVETSALGRAQYPGIDAWLAEERAAFDHLG